MQRPSRRLLLLAVAALAACASPPPPERAPSPPGVGHHAARTASSLVGAPYRYGGSSPKGFDCSGLVVYSFAQAGLAGLPHSAARLKQLARPVPLDDLEPGDLLFFELAKRKTSHVAIYVGDRSFVHAPSGGKRVERVRFDDVYWSRQLGRAGRLDL
jgi:cell wall-associated NlpC family hydrolase